MRAIFRVVWPVVAALVFLGWWENSTSPHYAGAPVWGLLMAGLFWFSAALAVYAAVDEIRSLLARRRGVRLRDAT